MSDPSETEEAASEEIGSLVEDVRSLVQGLQQDFHEGLDGSAAGEAVEKLQRIQAIFEEYR